MGYSYNYPTCILYARKAFLDFWVSYRTRKVEPSRNSLQRSWGQKLLNQSFQGNCTTMVNWGWNCIWPSKEEMEASKIPSKMDGPNKVVPHTVAFCHTHNFSPSDWMEIEMELNEPWQFYNHTNILPFSYFSSEPLAMCLTKCLNG